MMGVQQYLEVSLDNMGPSSLQLSCGLAILRQLIAVGIYNAQVAEQVWPTLAAFAE